MEADITSSPLAVKAVNYKVEFFLRLSDVAICPPLPVGVIEIYSIIGIATLVQEGKTMTQNWRKGVW